MTEKQFRMMQFKELARQQKQLEKERKARQMTKDSIEIAVKKIGKRSGISKNVTPHKFRHTTATQGLEAGMAIENIQMLLGHSDISTTMVYAKTNRSKVKTEHQRYVV